MPSVHNFLCYRQHFVIYSFNSPDLQNFLKEWANKQNTINKLKYEADHTPDEKVRLYLLKRINDLETELETFTI